VVARSTGQLQPFTITVTMQSLLPGHLQVFYDSGSGFSEPRSAAVALQPSQTPHQYRVGLPAGRYRAFLINPGTLVGRYVIKHAAILAPDGSIHAAIPLPSLVAADHTTVRKERRVVSRWIATGIRDASGKHRHVRRLAAFQGRHDLTQLPVKCQHAVQFR
jgi:hypothetical protein